MLEILHHLPSVIAANFVEHLFETMNARTGATHFLTKRLPRATAEMALSAVAQGCHDDFAVFTLVS